MSLYSTDQFNGFNNSNYIQIKPNKMIRAELLRKDVAQQKNPQYVRTKPNKIVRTISAKPIVIPVQPVVNAVAAESDKALPVTVSTKIDKTRPVTIPIQADNGDSGRTDKALARQTRPSLVVRPSARNGSNRLQSLPTLFGPHTKSNKYTRPDIDSKMMKKEDSSSRQPPTPPFKTRLINQYCKYFHKCGRCKDGDKCAYKHNPARVAVCKLWLSDRCKMGGKCPLQHEESPHVVPHCRHFNHGLCINPKCHYTHVHVNSRSPYCQYFDKDKYCPKGEECKLKHEWRLANFDEDETEQTNASSSDSNELGKRKREDDLQRRIRIKQPGENIDPFRAQFDYISLDDYPTDPK